MTNGVITTAVGSGVGGYSGDGGQATSAQLLLPDDIFVSSSSVMFIADSNNHRIRMVPFAVCMLSAVVVVSVVGGGVVVRSLFDVIRLCCCD